MKQLAHQDKLRLDAIARIELLHQAPESAAVTTRIGELLKCVDQNDRTLVAQLEKMK